MGFSLVGATAIIGVAVLISLELILGSAIPTITEIHESYDEMKDRSIKQVQTDINITDVDAVANDSNYDINITVENTGSITLDINNFNLLLDGTEYSFSCESTYLYPENTEWLILENIELKRPPRLKVITNNGISDYYQIVLP